jgi:maltooligosyltrehalose trehalohydrolase
LAAGFIYQGEFAPFWGKRRGEPSGELPPTAFVNFLQNHDQIGNRALGDRLQSIAGGQAVEAALAITLLAPMIPLLFMGEEWGSKVPFPFFCDFEGELAEAVRAGRRREYGWAYATLGQGTHGHNIPDPLDPATFRSARLDWEAREGGDCRERLTLVRKLLSIRHREIVPRLEGAAFDRAHGRDDGLLTAHWHMGDGARLLLSANLSAAAVIHQATETKARPIWGGEPGGILPPWSVFWQIAQQNC